MLGPAQSNFVSGLVEASGEGSECLQGRHRDEVASEDELRPAECSYFPDSSIEWTLNQIYDLNLQDGYRREGGKKPVQFPTRTGRSLSGSLVPATASANSLGT